MPTAASVFFHNYYGKDEEWMAFFSTQMILSFNLFYNCVSGSYQRIISNANAFAFQEPFRPCNTVQTIIKESTNKGKDIGGKLVLMDAYLKLDMESNYILLLHDKVSPYHSHNEQWKKSLFRIAEKAYQEKIMALFDNPETGIVASENMIRNEEDNEQKTAAYTDSRFIRELRMKYGIQPPHLSYVAGTMFWVRATLFETFFKQHPPLEIRSTLEEGNVTDEESPTVTHAWERLLCWMVTARGYKIKGV